MLFTTRQLVQLQKMYKLTNRELQIVRLLAQGIDSNEELGKRLDLSMHTVKVYLRNIYLKVGRNSKLSVIVGFAEDVK